jgi:broad specificity phosphatase PhoE
MADSVMAGHLVIVRHGRTAFNATGRLQGRTDNPLDDVGEEQARRVARHLLPALDRDAIIISSPLVRAQQTAGAIAEELGLEIAVDDRWIEIDYGVYEGVPQADVPADVWAAWRSDPSFAPEAGESLRSVQERVSQACEDLLVTLDGRTAVIVTHVSPIKSSIAWALGVDVGIGWRTHLDTASVSRIAVTPRGPVLRTFNEPAP